MKVQQMEQVVFRYTASLHTHDRQIIYKVTTEKLRNDSLLLLSVIKKAADVVKNPILFLPITQKIVNWCGGQKKRRKC